MMEYRSPENALGEEKKNGRAERYTENTTITKLRCSQTTITRAFAVARSIRDQSEGRAGESFIQHVTIMPHWSQTEHQLQS